MTASVLMLLPPLVCGVGSYTSKPDIYVDIYKVDLEPTDWVV